MKKFIPIILAVIAFLAVWMFLSPEPQGMVAVAVTDITAGHLIGSTDVEIKSMPKSLIPQDAVTNLNDVLGMTLKVDRAQGDIIHVSQIGEEVIDLAPNERAVAVTVDNATGFAGLLKAGDYVGLDAIISLPGKGDEGTYSKVAIENLRLLYLSPEFSAITTNVQTSDQSTTSGAVYTDDRSTTGVVILAVPIDAQTIIYDFSKVDSTIPTKSETVYVIELLTALESSSNAKLYLYLMPHDAQKISTSGLWLEDVVILGKNPTPTIDPMLYLEETPAP